MKRKELIEAAVTGIKAGSRYLLSKSTGITEGTLSLIANGKQWPTNNQTRILAEAAGLPWAEVVADLEMEKAKDEQTKTAWGKALASLRRVAVAFALAVLASLAANSSFDGFAVFYRRLRRTIIMDFVKVFP